MIDRLLNICVMILVAPIVGLVLVGALFATLMLMVGALVSDWARSQSIR